MTDFNTEALFDKRMLEYQKRFLESDIDKLEKKLEAVERPGNIVIKRIKGKTYYYEQTYCQGKMTYRSLGPVKPGAISELEIKQMEFQEIMNALEEKRIQLDIVKAALSKCPDKPLYKAPDPYTFETYWKNQITARVYVRPTEVLVTRITSGPFRQLFFANKMTNAQLMQVLELRCWDRNRADINLLLNRMGLTEYNPLEIVKRTHGTTVNDFFWFRFQGEKLTAKDVLKR
ncbi:MAG: hypothetical protein HUJ98_10750 [Bacteroidaceae bacterium]|nr:hypothetical protein [Bacteroidaceae bacterium]